MFEIPYHDVVRVLISVKFKQYWPNLRFHISGREIYFAGPEKDIDECSVIIGNSLNFVEKYFNHYSYTI